MAKSTILVCALCGVAASSTAAQLTPEYLDPGAAALHRAATANHLAAAHRLTAYEATLRQRIGVRLRLPLKDRTLYHAESAHRVTWRRQGPVTIAALGIRETTPAGLDEDEIDFGLVDDFWDPARDRLLLGAREPGEADDPDDFSIDHPLEPEGAGAYRFASGDTVTLVLPDGRRIRAIELRMTPHVRGPTRLVGSLWIEPERGALVRAAYRMSETLDVLRDIEDMRQENARGEFRWVPGLFKPWTFDATLITVDYALWEGDVWLPLRWRAEGVVRAGVLEAPAELDRMYRFAWIGTEGPEESPEPSALPTPDPEGYHLASDEERRRHGLVVRILVPDDPGRLRDSPELPPPVWDDAPGFVSDAEIGALVAQLDDIPAPPAASLPWRFAWGFQEADLVRYNRVEELSVGARGVMSPDLAGRPLSIEGTVRIGTGDRHPNARVDLTRSSLRRSLTLSAYHELAATDERARHLGFGSSAMALLFGRDDGDYYRRSGGTLAIGPPPQGRSSWSIALSSEWHEPVRVRTRASLARLWEDGGWAFRPSLPAEEGWGHAVTVHLAPSTGADPQEVQAGLSWTGTAAAGPLGHLRSMLTGRLLAPLGAEYRIGATAWGGVASSDVPIQRALAVGGTGSLRGYAPRTLVGPCAAGGTLELQRVLSGMALALFADTGWAGACDDLEVDALLSSVGVGVSLLDGLLRLDLARGLESGSAFRFDIWLDGAF